MIFNVLALALLRGALRLGLAPVSAIIRRALAAVRKDDLDGAVQLYFDAAARDFSSEKVQVLREILISEIRFRKKALIERATILAENSKPLPEAKSEIASCESAIKILDGFLVRLGAVTSTEEN
jgi:hypothetical protein